MSHRLANGPACELENFECARFKYIAAISQFADGRPAEIFLNGSGKSGTPLEIAARDAAICTSLYFQRGGVVDELRHAHAVREGL
jgi:hypothetical protein